MTGAVSLAHSGRSNVVADSKVTKFEYIFIFQPMGLIGISKLHVLSVTVSNMGESQNWLQATAIHTVGPFAKCDTSIYINYAHAQTLRKHNS